MWKKTLAIFCILGLLFVLTACATTDIESDEQAVEEIGDINEEIASITDDLNEINEELGSEEDA